MISQFTGGKTSNKLAEPRKIRRDRVAGLCVNVAGRLDNDFWSEGRIPEKVVDKGDSEESLRPDTDGSPKTTENESTWSDDRTIL